MPLLLGILLAVNTTPSVLSVSQPPDYTSTSTVRAYIESQTDLPRAVFIARGESHFVWNERGDMDIICWNKRSPFYGKPVAARGVWQITRCYHPEVTDAQADDVEWSTAWALPRIADKKKCIKEWTQCRLYYAFYPVDVATATSLVVHGSSSL